MPVKSRVIDGIVWLAVGVSLVGQAGFLVAMNWWPEGSSATDAIPSSVAGGIVAVGFVAVGLGAFAIGVRQLLTVWRAR